MSRTMWFGNHELQYYENDFNTISIKDGKLFISAYFDSLANSFKSAKITSNGKVDFQTGYVEIVAQLPNAVGLGQQFGFYLLWKENLIGLMMEK